jgi:hypothetical protein
MNKLFAISALLVTSLAGVAATHGLAIAEENGKLYPAFGCVEAGTGGGGTINRNEVRVTKSSGGVDETATILCPIIRDERASSVGGIGSAVVHVLDTILNKDVSCTLNARSYANGPIKFETQATSGVDSDGDDLVFDGFSLGFNANHDAHYYFQCQVPTNQGVQVVKIYSYEVTEH